MRLASPFQSLDLNEEKTEAEACFVSAETTVTAAVDLRLRDAKKPEWRVSDGQGRVGATTCHAHVTFGCALRLSHGGPAVQARAEHIFI